MKKYDAIVIGSGAGGGVAAAVLAEAGKSVLLLERGRDLSNAAIGRDHLRNQRISRYGHNAGPDIEGNPRTSEDGRVIRPHQFGYQNNAACIGSGTRVYAGQAWRFMPQDFRMASIYGVPEGSSLADWPIDYAELAPYYEKVEWQLGVCGDHTGMTHLPDYAKPYPMPALPLPSKSRVFQDALESLGWGSLRMPRLINSVPYNGRPACVYCQHCFGFACPSDAKNGSHNTGIPRAIASGNCSVRSQVMAKRLLTTPGGAVKGVTVIDENGGESDIESRLVVLSCGAVETARLLFNSATKQEPKGIGNCSDLVGRNLQGHYYPMAMGLFPFDIYGDGIGPGGSVATCDFNHGNGDIIGGGMLADCDIGLPVVVWQRPFPGGCPTLGRCGKTIHARQLPPHQRYHGSGARDSQSRRPRQNQSQSQRSPWHPGRAPVRQSASRDGAHRRLHAQTRQGVAACRWRDADMGRCAAGISQRRAASSRHRAHGRRSGVLSRRSLLPRPQPRQPLRRRLIAACDERRL